MYWVYRNKNMESFQARWRFGTNKDVTDINKTETCMAGLNMNFHITGFGKLINNQAQKHTG